MEKNKEVYFKLESNDDKGYIIVPDLLTVRELIDTDLGDVDPNDVEDVFYTITPVMMTADEYLALDANDDW